MSSSGAVGVLARTVPWHRNQRLVLGLAAMVLLTPAIKVGLGLLWPMAVVLSVQVVLFVALFRRPVWALAALMVGQFTASSFMVSLTPQLQISLRFLWTLMAVPLLVPILRNSTGINLGSRWRRIVVPAGVFFLLASLANVINVDWSLSVLYLRQSASALAILILLPAVVEKEGDVRLLAIVVLITGVVSSVAAVMQHYSFLGLPVLTIFSDILHKGRATGLAGSPVQLSLHLPMVLLPVLGVILLRGTGTRMRDLLALSVLVMSVALYYTGTRSGIYAVGGGLLALALPMKPRMRLAMLVGMAVLAAGFFLYSGWQDNRYSQGFEDDSSAAGRLVLWQAGVKIALDNPVLGIGYDRFEDASLEYAAQLDPENMATQGASGVLGRYEPHNDFIRVWLSFGTGALIAYVMIFVGIFFNFAETYRVSRNRFLKGFAVGCSAALLAYLVNAFTHNVMGTGAYMWILGGLSLATTKLALNTRRRVEKELS